MNKRTLTLIAALAVSPTASAEEPLYTVGELLDGTLARLCTSVEGKQQEKKMYAILEAQYQEQSVKVREELTRLGVASPIDPTIHAEVYRTPIPADVQSALDRFWNVDTMHSAAVSLIPLLTGAHVCPE